MENHMANYDPQKEDNKTLEIMANNFDQWYDWDPTQDQSQKFEEFRIKKIKSDYVKYLQNIELEEKSFEMIIDDKDIQNAIQDATEFHKNQYRKINGAPFIYHPIAVAKIINSIFQDKQLVIAALLHDVKEDVENGKELLESKYPEDILQLIDGVTEQDKSLPRKERKIAYIKHLDGISYKILALSMSDRIQNLRDMIKWLENNGHKMFEKFNAWFEEQKWFILSYSLKVKKIIDTLPDEKIKWKCLDLYKHLSVLIWYFLEIGKNK